MRWNKWKSPLKAALGALDRKWPTCAESFTALLSTTVWYHNMVVLVRKYHQNPRYSLFTLLKHAHTATQTEHFNRAFERKRIKICFFGDFCLSFWWQVTSQYFVDRHLWSLNCWSFVSHNCCHGINVKNAENNFGITSKFTDRPTGAPTLTASSRSLQKITSVKIH